MKYIIYDKVSMLLLLTLLAIVFLPTEFNGILKKGMAPLLESRLQTIHEESLFAFEAQAKSLLKLIMKTKRFSITSIRDKKEALALVVQKMSAEDVANKKNELLKIAKALPGNKLRDNLAGYHLLTVFEPQSELYNSKVEKYSRLLHAQERKEAEGLRYLASQVQGSWKGAYTCDKDKTPVTLDIESSPVGHLESTLQYARKKLVFGYYRLTFSQKGNISYPSRYLELNPSRWIQKPIGHDGGMFSTHGTLSKNGRTITYRPSSGCSLLLTKQH